MTFLKAISVILLFGCFSILMVSGKINDKLTSKAFYNKDSVFAVYEYLTSDRLAGAAITLKYDKSFSYSIGTDIQQSFSSGRWEIVKDTLILTSFTKREDIPVSIDRKSVV